MLVKIVLTLLLFCGAALPDSGLARQGEAIIAGNGTPGPFYLGALYPDSASITVDWAAPGDSLWPGEVPPFVYVGTVNGILFAGPLDSSARVRVSFTLAYQSVPKLVRAYVPLPMDLDSSLSDTQLIDLREPARPVGEALAVSGYKSIGVSLGSLGQLTVEQALDITISGEVQPGTELSAHISDQGSSLESVTREVGELDLVYVTLAHERFGVTVGDQYVQWPFDGPFASSRKIKGISARYGPATANVRAFGALQGGRTAVQSINGRDGHQGPYFLTGNGEAEGVSPLAGTVSVTVDGQVLKEGAQEQYTVDYESGAISFTPRYLLTADRVIRVVYEYKTYDYLRTGAGTMTGVTLADSALSASGALWYEGDNPAQPIDFTLGSQDRKALRRAGDQESGALYVRLLDPRDVARESAVAALYRRADTLVGGSLVSVFVYAPWDPLSPAHSAGVYRVSFVRVDSGSGEYAIDSIAYGSAGIPLAIHKWVGPGRGSYTVPESKPAPRSNVMGQLRLEVKPRSWLTVATDILGSAQDNNRLSPLDDNDNLGAAAHTRIMAGSRSGPGVRLWSNASHKLTTRDFSGAPTDRFELQSRWHDESASGDTLEQHLIEAQGGALYTGRGEVMLRGGQRILDKEVATQTAGGTVVVSPLALPLRLNLSSDLYTHAQNPTLRASRTDQVQLSGTVGKSSFNGGLFDEWRRGESGPARGHVGARGGFSYEPLGLSQQISYAQQQTGNRRVFGFVQSPDSGSSLVWEQGLSFNPLSAWKLGATSALHRRKVHSGTHNQTVLATVSSDIASARTGWSSAQQYALSVEQASAVVQVPRYAGKNLGTHIYDSLTGEYVIPRSGPGDFLLVEREMFDTLGGTGVRSTNLSVAWSYVPRGGPGLPLLNDLEWRGALRVEEQVNLEALSDNLLVRSWVPGGLTLTRVRAYSPNLSTAYGSYLQELLWRPRSEHELAAEARARPYVRQSFLRRESGIDASLAVEGRSGNMLLRGENRWYLLRSVRPAASEWYRVYDGVVELTQEYSLPAQLSVGLTQSAGRAQKGQQYFELPDSSWYFSAGPKLRWAPNAGGWAELSWTGAAVMLPVVADYRMAGGLPSGVSHILELFADIELGTHFVLSATARAAWNRPWGTKAFAAEYVLSTRVKASL